MAFRLSIISGKGEDRGLTFTQRGTRTGGSPANELVHGAGERRFHQAQARLAELSVGETPCY